MALRDCMGQHTGTLLSALHQADLTVEELRELRLSEYRYTIILRPEPEEGGCSVTVPPLPGCLAQGDSLEEAVAMAKEAIAVHIQGLIEDGEPVPTEDSPLGMLTISVDAPAA